MPESIYDHVAVVIPALNEARHIGPICAQLAARGASVIVVDDGSTDATAAVARACGAGVISHATRRGKGAAVRTGITAALDRPTRWVAVMDGDSQHTVSDLDRLVEFARRGGHDLVLGQRVFTPDMPPVRRATNWLMSAVIGLFTGRAIPDSQCGLRVMSAGAAWHLRPQSSHYEVESEMLIRACRRRMAIGLLPIETVYPAEHRSAIRPVLDAARWLRLLVRLSLS